MAIIYLTTNKINNKKYIGVDTRNNPYYLGSGILIKKAIKKYGKQNFSKEILEENESVEYIFSREDYWIQKHNAVLSEKFYNLAPGGKGGNNLNNEDSIKRCMQGAEKGRKIVIEKRKGKIYEEIYGENATIEKEKRARALAGKKRPKDIVEKVRAALKGKEPWNKGLNTTDPRVMAYVKKRPLKEFLYTYILTEPNGLISEFNGRKKLEIYIKNINIERSRNNKINVSNLIIEGSLHGFIIFVKKKQSI